MGRNNQKHFIFIGSLILFCTMLLYLLSLPVLRATYVSIEGPQCLRWSERAAGKGAIPSEAKHSWKLLVEPGQVGPLFLSPLSIIFFIKRYRYCSDRKRLAVSCAAMKLFAGRRGPPFEKRICN